MGKVGNVKKKSQAVGGNSRFHACDFYISYSRILPKEHKRIVNVIVS